MTRWMRFFRQLGTLFVLTGMTIAASTVANVVVASSLGPANYGDVVFAVSLGAIVALLAQYGFDRTLVRDLVQRPEGLRVVLSGSLLIRGVLLLIALAVVSFLMILDVLPGASAGAFLLILAATIKGLDLRPLFDVRNRTARHASILLGERLLYVCIILLSPRVSISLLGAAAFLAAATSIMLQYWLAMSDIDLRFRRDVVRFAAGQLVANAPIWLAASATLAIGPVINVLLRAFTDSRQVGGFGVALMFVSLASVVFNQLCRLLTPRLARRCQGQRPCPDPRFSLGYLAIFTLAGLLLGLPAILAPELVLVTMFGPDYAFAWPIFMVIGVYLPFWGCDFALSRYLVATRHDRAYSVIVIVCSLAGWVAAIPFILFWGGTGAGWAMVAARASLIALCVPIVSRDAGVFPGRGLQLMTHPFSKVTSCLPSTEAGATRAT